MKRGRITFLAAGLLIGAVLGIGAAFWFGASQDAEAATIAVQAPTHLSGRAAEVRPQQPQWEKSTVYTAGDQVVYENRIYRAKWWTQGEIPASADVWEDTGTSVGVDTITAEPPPNVKKPDAGEFKVVGYFPSWKPAQTDKLRYDVLTHINYAFAIPTAEGRLRPLDAAETAAKIIEKAHQNNVKVLLAVGGWSYNDVPLEAVFMAATATEAKRAALVKAIVSMCSQYGFDGVDMDWEHPRVDGTSAKQYQAFMLLLADELHSRGKLLTAAVLSGATADGNVYYDAAAHSDAVLNAVDWINVMAYDGGDGERHSPYEFAVNAASYWKDTRKLAAEKVVLGMPFYGRPGWASYEEMLRADPEAVKKDQMQYNGMTAWYNGAGTIERKTRYAAENLGGVMIWEVTQDTTNESKSLMTAIRNVLSQ